MFFNYLYINWRRGHGVLCGEMQWCHMKVIKRKLQWQSFGRFLWPHSSKRACVLLPCFLTDKWKKISSCVSFQSALSLSLKFTYPCQAKQTNPNGPISHRIWPGKDLIGVGESWIKFWNHIQTQCVILYVILYMWGQKAYDVWFWFKPVLSWLICV